MTPRIEKLLQEELAEESLKKTFSLLALAGLLATGNAKASEIYDTLTNSSKETAQTEMKNILGNQGNFDGFTEMQALNVIARTLWGEARGESKDGRKAVASVIWNRANGNPRKLARVCLAKNQFSAWNKMTDFERSPEGFSIKVPSNAVKNIVWDECKKIAEDMVYGSFRPTVSATHYYVTDMPSPPKWTKQMPDAIKIGSHTFGTPDWRIEVPEEEISSETTYVVQKGDNLSKIAKKFNKSVGKIVSMNKLKPPDAIRIGQKIKIPN